MSPQEYLIAITFILLTLFWLGIISILAVGCTNNFFEGKFKPAIVCLVLTIIFIVVGIVGFKYMSDFPEMEFLRGDKCTECGNLLDTADKFCDQCGAEVPAETAPKCNKCHAEYEEDDRYCAECGAQLSTGE